MAINPTTLVGGKGFQPAKLFDPNSIGFAFLTNGIMDLLSHIQLEDYYDYKVTKEDLSISEIDVTQNLWFDDGTNLEPLIRFFKKSKMPNNFRRNKKIIGYCINADIVTFKAYDKIRDLHDSNHLPEALANKIILRLEVSMKREKFIHELQLNRDETIDTMLHAAYHQAQDIIMDYLKKLFPSSAPHFSYKTACDKVKQRVKKEKLKERMLFLLQKTADTDGLDKAVRSTMKKYND